MPFKTNLIGIISLLLFFIVFTDVCLPQSESYLDSLDGKFALQFQISDNFNLTNFQGSTFSGKYHFGCRSAVRVGFSVSLTNSDSKNNETFHDTISNSTKVNTDVFGMTIRTQYIHYIPGMYDIMFFIGGGPFVGFNNGTSEIDYTSPDTVLHRKESIDDFSAGLDLIVGIEWMFIKNMSLSAEYGIVFLYNSSTRNSEDINTITKTTNNRFSIGNGDVNFGISVYF